MPRYELGTFNTEMGLLCYERFRISGANITRVLCSECWQSPQSHLMYVQVGQDSNISMKRQDSDISMKRRDSNIGMKHRDSNIGMKHRNSNIGMKHCSYLE